MAEITRRAFLRDFGQGTLAVAILGVAVVACGDDSGGAVASTVPPGSSTTPTSTHSSTPAPSDSSEPFVWERVDLGFVSAYVLVRRGEATVVDTGVSGSSADIEASLAGLGAGWGDVGHVILTHLHGDHVGSLTDVLEAAPAAVAYAGAEDIPEIDSPRTLTAIGDGDSVSGLEIIATPGHTPGHISVLDRAGGLLVAGDALNGAGTGVGGPNPQFSSDMEEANSSVVKLAGFEYEAVVFGHGSPVLSGASSQVAELAAAL